MKRKNILFIILFLLLGIVAGFYLNKFLEEREVGPVFVNETKEIYIQENVALVKMVEKVSQAVVGVKTKTKSGQVLEGAGLVITSDGLIVTLAELVPAGSQFSFFVDQEIVPYQILKRDLENNLALVKVTHSSLTTLGFANLEKLKAGERVFLVGNLFEKEEVLKIVNEGITKVLTADLIQTNIFESSSLAGSPLFNIEGGILGINTIDSLGRVAAIPINTIRTFIGL